MSLYRFKRASNGTIDSSSLQEIILAFDKSNGVVVYFEIEISKGEAIDYQYCIGMSSTAPTDASAGFVFLKLAGTDTSGGKESVNGKSILKIDFVKDTNVDLENMVVHNSHFQINDPDKLVTINPTEYYFNVLTSDNMIHYYNSNSSTVVLTQIIKIDPESILETSYSSSIFPNRIES